MCETLLFFYLLIFVGICTVLSATISPAFFVFWCLIGLPAIFAALLLSIYKIKPSEMLACWWAGNYIGTFVPKDYADEEEIRNAYLGLFGLGFAFLPPFFLFKVVRLPLTTLILRFEDLPCYVRHGKGKNPTFPIELTCSVSLRLGPYVGRLVESIDILSTYTSDDPEKLARILRNALSNTLQKAIRLEAARYSFDGKKDIRDELHYFALNVRKRLGEEKSIFAQAWLLTGGGYLGGAATSFDLNIIAVRPAGKKARDAQSLPYLANQVAQEQKIKGRGIHDRLTEIIKDTDMTLAEARQLEILEKSNVKIIGLGESIINILKGITKK